MPSTSEPNGNRTAWIVKRKNWIVVQSRQEVSRSYLDSLEAIPPTGYGPGFPLGLGVPDYNIRGLGNPYAVDQAS